MTRDRMVQTRKMAWLVGVALVAAITVGHYLTPTSSPQFHDAMRRMYYLPIVLVGVRCGMLAGLGIAVLAALAYFPHIYLHWGGDPLGAANLNRTFEVMMYLVVGLLTGSLADRERRARIAAEGAQAEAEVRAREARDAAGALLDAEEQLRRTDRLATLGILSASLAHEVRNPLGSLRGIADMLGSEFPEGHPRRELIDIMDAEVRRLGAVVDTYLDSARSRPGSEPARVADVVASVLRLLAYEASRQGVSCEAAAVPAELTLPLDEELLRQVLINLVLNGIQARAGESGHVSIEAGSEGDRVFVRCRDDGPGFPGEVMGTDPRPFYTTHRFGTGLGLPIVRRIVESRGGRLLLENLLGGGACAEIVFGGSRA